MFTLARRLIRPAAETDAKIDAKWLPRPPAKERMLHSILLILILID